MPRQYTPRVTLTCATCSQAFIVPARLSTTARFCSYKCVHAAHSTRPIRACQRCGSSFKAMHATSRYCSPACWYADSATKHGKSGTVEYRIWSGMRGRCQEKTGRAARNYRDRGIVVCPEWDSFEQFLKDMGPRPSPKHSIDRIDGNGPYAPWNCRWATPTEQLNNTRVNVRLTYQGRTLTLSQWARELGIDRRTLDARRRDGLPVEQVLFPGRLPIGRPKQTR